MADIIDRTLVQPIDIYDNGIDLVKETVVPDIRPADIKSIFWMFRPTWKEEDLDLDLIFMQLVSYAKVILQRAIKAVGDEAEAVSLVQEAYESAPDKRLIILDERYPWEDVLMQFPEPLFVVYPKRVDGTWSLKTISTGVTYESRKDLPQSWAGKHDEEFENITGVSGAIFCHNRIFLAVAKTKEAILKLAEIALNS